MTSRTRRALSWIVVARSGSAAVVQSIFVRIALAGLNLATGMYAARHFGAAGRGLLAAILLWGVLLGYLFTLGIPLAVRYESRANEARRDSIFSASLILTAAIGVVAALTGVLVVPHALHRFGPENVRYAQLMMAFTPLAMLGGTLLGIVEVRFEFALANFTRIAAPVMTFVALVTLATLHRFEPFYVAIAYTAPACVMGLMMAIHLYGKFRFTLAGFRDSVWRLTNYGLRIYGADVFSALGQQIDQILVVAYLSARDLGIYTVALTASRVILIFQSSLWNVAFAKFSGLEDRAVVGIVGRIVRLNAAATGLAGAVLFVLMPLLLPTLYGRDFAASVGVARLLVVEAVLASTASALAQTFVTTGRPALWTMLQAVGLALAFPLMYVLIPRLGVMGAAVALLVSTSVRVLLAMVAYPVALKYPIPSLVATRSDLDFFRDTFGLRRKAGT